MNAEDYEAEWKWINSSPEAKNFSDAAKTQAFSNFKKRFPRADVTSSCQEEISGTSSEVRKSSPQISTNE